MNNAHNAMLTSTLIGLYIVCIIYIEDDNVLKKEDNNTSLQYIKIPDMHNNSAVQQLV